MNDDNLERRLNEAGDRLRNTAPDDIAATQAFRRRHERSPDQPPPTRNWWPALAGAGLVGAAILGVVAYGSLGQDDAIVTPADTAVTVPQTTVSRDTISTDVSIGTIPPAVVVEPVVVATAPTEPPTTSVDTASVGTPPPPTTTIPDTPGCPTRITPPAGTQLITVACQNVDGNAAALVAQVPDGASIDEATRWFVNSPRWPDGPIELGLPSPVSGPIPDTISFLPVLDNGVTCAVIVQTSSGVWKEDCWLDAPVPQLLTDFGAATVQFDLSDLTAITSTALSESAWKSSGCDNNDAGELAALAEPDGAMYGAVGCNETAAAIVSGSIFMQPGGGPDGSIWLFERVGDSWEMVDNGTGIDTDLPVPIPDRDLWVTWPGDVNPRPSSLDLDELNARPLFDDLPTPEAVADAVLSILDGERDSEFTGPAFPLEIVGIFDDLIVIESIEGGDDSVAGTGHYIHVGPGLGGNGGYGVRQWFTSAICARGGDVSFCL